MAEPEIVSDPTQDEPVTPVIPVIPAIDHVRDAISQAAGSQERTQPTEASADAEKGAGSKRVLTSILVIALVLAGLTLINQSRRTRALENQVVALEAEVAGAEAAVAAYQSRFVEVREEVGELTTRIGALSRLVTREVLPAGVSDTAGETAGAVGFPE